MDSMSQIIVENNVKLHVRLHMLLYLNNSGGTIMCG